jgi:hypothetical protein
MPVEVGGNASNSNRELAGRPLTVSIFAQVGFVRVLLETNQQ